MKTSKTGPRLKKPGGEGLLRASPFLLPSLIGLAIFYLAPMVVSIFISLTDWNGLDRLFADGFMQEHFIGLDNYKAILTSQEFWKVLKNTLTYIVLYLPLMMAVSLAVASLLSQQRRGVGVFRVLYYIPVLTSWVAASLIWKSILAPQYGAMNNILAFFGIEGPGWLLDEKWAMPAIVLVSVWKDMGFFGLILLSGMVGINRTYYEAAEIDGAGARHDLHARLFELIEPFGADRLDFGHDDVGTVFPDGGGQRVAVEHVKHFACVGDLHGGGARIRVAGDDGLPQPLRRDRELLAQLSRAQKQYLFGHGLIRIRFVTERRE